MEYYIFWIDKYVNGYRKGVTHAFADDGTCKSLCGIKSENIDLDGGYDTANDGHEIECKKCLKSYNNISHQIIKQ